MHEKPVLPVFSTEGYEKLIAQAVELALAFSRKRGEDFFPSHAEIKEACEAIGMAALKDDPLWGKFYGQQLRSAVLKRFRAQTRAYLPNCA